MYLIDGSSGRVRRIDGNGTISTVAGGGAAAPSTTPAPATSVRLGPDDIAVDPAGGFWIVDHRNAGEDEARLLHVDAKGALTLVPLDDDARFSFPFPLAVGPDGAVYLGGDAFLYRLGEGGSTTAVGGPFAGRISDLAVAQDGTVHVATPGVVERLVVPDEREGRKLPEARAAADRWAGDEPGAVHRVAGDGEHRRSDHTPPAEPELGPTRPRDVALAPGGGAYVLDAGNARVLSVSQTGELKEFAKLPGGQGRYITGLARGGDGALHTLDAKGGTVFRIGAGGAVTTPHTLVVAQDQYPGTLVLDKAGNAYLPSGKGQVLRFAPGGGAVPIAGGVTGRR